MWNSSPRGIVPCELLTRAQTRAGVGNRVIGIQPPRLQVEQMPRLMDTPSRNDMNVPHP